MFHFRRKITAYVMLLPYLIGLLGLVALPALLSFWLALTRFNALTSPEWVGPENFALLLQDRLFGIAVANTLFYIMLATALRTIGAFGLAMAFQRRFKGVDLARVTVYMPTVIPNIAYALIWLMAFNPRFGPINLFLGMFGLPAPAWLAEPGTARLALVIMALWQLGEGFVVFLASLGDVPAGLYETAEIDGAGSWARFWHITLPLMLPRLLLLSARDLILNLQANFAPSLVMTRGGPGYATLFLPLYSYQLAFDDLRFGYAAAVVWAMYVLTAAIVGLQYFIGRRRQHQEAFE